MPWPLAWRHAFVLGREAASPFAMPADFVLWLVAAALVVLVCAPWLSRVLATGPQQIASAFAYPGLVFATGVGWLLLLDLSANGHLGNRYLALYHQGHLWLGMAALSIVAFVRQPLGRSLSWMLSLCDGVASRIGRGLGTAGRRGAPGRADAGADRPSIGTLLLNVRQLTSEIGRLWLIVGAAWFFFLRGMPLTERLARSGTSLGSLVRYVWPLLFVVIVLIGAMFITRDMGPLLIAGYGAGAFVAASVAMWWYQRHGTTGGAYAVGGRAVRRVDPGDDRRAVSGGRARRGRRGAARESRRAARVRERPARAGDVVPARLAPGRIRTWRGSVVRFRCSGRVRRRPGADPERLHVHGARRGVRLDGGLGDDARVRSVAASAHRPPRAGDARRAPFRQGRPGASATTTRRS